MTAFILTVVMFFANGTLDTFALHMTDAAGCQRGAEAAIAKAKEQGNRIKYMCTEVSDDFTEEPKLPPGHPPIGGRGA